MGDVAPRGAGPRPPAGRRPARRVTAERLGKEAWAPFGWVPVDDTDPSDGDNGLTFSWGDPHVNVIMHRAEEIRRIGDILRCTEMFRHDTHTQVLLVLDVRAVMCVAPASVTFSSAEDAGAVRAFLLEPLDSVVLHPGTWHWGPFPVQAEAVHLFNVQGLRYAEDNRRVDLEGAGASVEVLIAGS